MASKDMKAVSNAYDRNEGDRLTKALAEIVDAMEVLQNRLFELSISSAFQNPEIIASVSKGIDPVDISVMKKHLEQQRDMKIIIDNFINAKLS